MNRPISTVEIEERMILALEKIETILDDYQDAMRRAVTARNRERRASAERLVALAAQHGKLMSADVRKAQTEWHCADYRDAAEIAEAERDILRERLRAGHLQVDVLRTLNANVRQAERSLG